MTLNYKQREIQREIMQEHFACIDEYENKKLIALLIYM